MNEQETRYINWPCSRMKGYMIITWLKKYAKYRTRRAYLSPKEKRKLKNPHPPSCADLADQKLLPRLGRSPKPFLHARTEKPLSAGTILTKSPSTWAARTIKIIASRAAAFGRWMSLLRPQNRSTQASNLAMHKTDLSIWMKRSWALPVFVGGKGMVGKGVRWFTKYFKKNTLYWVLWGRAKGASWWFGNSRAKTGGKLNTRLVRDQKGA